MNRRKKRKKVIWFTAIILQRIPFLGHSEHFVKVTFIHTSGLILHLIKINTYSLIHCHFFSMLILGNVFPHNYLLGDAKAESKQKTTPSLSDNIN